MKIKINKFFFIDNHRKLVIKMFRNVYKVFNLLLYMGDEKKGAISGWTSVAVYILIILIGIVALLSFAGDTEGYQNFINGAPNFVSSTIDIVVSIGAPLVSGVYWIVAPAGQDENVQMIAFSIFLLLTLVGNQTLSNFFRQPNSFLISLLIGVIAARSLTATVLEETAIGASPLAAASLLIGFIPIFALSKNIDKWGISQVSKVIVYLVTATIYLFTFWFSFNSLTLGIVYSTGIILLAAGQEIVPYFKKTANRREDMSLGRWLAGNRRTLESLRNIRQGDQQASGQSP
jgi:hypothetical protein